MPLSPFSSTLSLFPSSKHKAQFSLEPLTTEQSIRKFYDQYRQQKQREQEQEQQYQYQQIKHQQLHISVLNFANAYSPGGSYLDPDLIMAAKEELCRSAPTLHP